MLAGKRTCGKRPHGVRPCQRSDRVGGVSARCESVSPTTLEAIASGLTVTGGGTLRDGQAVRSEDFERVWFVAAEIDGSGIEGDGEVGVWATNGDPASGEVGSIFAVDTYAQESSDWGPGDQTDDELTMADDGAQEAQDCVG